MATTASEASCSDDEPPEQTDTTAAAASKGGLRELLRIAIPTALANLAEYLPVSVALYFIGRRGSADDLDAVGLGRSYFNISCFSTSYGLISALRTLCPQAAGARKGKELHGLYAQRALVIVALAAIIGIIGVYFADAVLIHVLGQPRQLARRAQRYGLALLPALFGIPCMTIVQRVMTAEGHVFANLAICAAVFATAPAWQNFLVYRHGLGYVGAAWASSITNNQYLLLQVPYCLYVGLGHVFRPRSFREVFDRRGISEFLGLSLPGLAASLLEWWSFELVFALAGTRRSPAVLAAVTCALNIQTVLEMCWLGAMVATSVAVGAQVGAGDPKGAKRAARLGVLAAFCAAAITAAGLIVARPLIARLYSHDADVVALTSRCVPALALLVFFDAQNVCIQGTLSGAGAPQRIAMSNLIGWYGVAAPVALGLLFGLDLDQSAAPVLLCCSVWKSNVTAHLRPRPNHDLHAIDATPARRRGGVDSSPLDGASTAASSSRNDLVENYRVHPTHCLISTQTGTTPSARPGRRRAGHSS